MSYSQSKKSTNTEKKLQALKTQLYGKEHSNISMQSTTTNKFHLPSQDLPASQPTKQPTTIMPNYLRQDLLKIALLAAIAISVQVIVYLKFR